jgi:hypothetical protein
MRTKTFQRRASQDKTREIQRQASEQHDSREMQSQSWPAWVTAEELFDVHIRNSPVEGQYVISVARRGNGEVAQRARPAGTAYAEALRLAQRSIFGLYDDRRGR